LQPNKKKVLLIAGPTAVGKTALSLALAQQFNGEIISGDSMQVYRRLDIGTAKVMPAELQFAGADVTEQVTQPSSRRSSMNILSFVLFRF